MRLRCILVVAWLGIAIVGCGSSDIETTSAETASAPAERERPSGSPGESETSQASTVPNGWKVYTPPEGDFSVVVPGEPVESSSKDTKIGKLRRYSFEKNGAPLAVVIDSDRPGEFATNTVEELRTDNPDILPGTLRDVLLAGMPGIEFRTRGRVGVTVFREYCSPDNSRSISLFAQKDLGDGLTETEVRRFLESFKLVP